MEKPAPVKTFTTMGRGQGTQARVHPKTPGQGCRPPSCSLKSLRVLRTRRGGCVRPSLSWWV